MMQLEVNDVNFKHLQFGPSKGFETSCISRDSEKEKNQLCFPIGEKNLRFEKFLSCRKEKKI